MGKWKIEWKMKNENEKLKIEKSENRKMGKWKMKNENEKLKVGKWGNGK